MKKRANKRIKKPPKPVSEKMDQSTSKGDQSMSVTGETERASVPENRTMSGSMVSQSTSVLENQPLSASEGNQSASAPEHQFMSVSEGDQSASVLENQPLSVSEGNQSASAPEHQFMSVSEGDKSVSVLENQPLSGSEGDQSVSVLENQPLSGSEGDQSVSVLENQPLSVSEGDQSVTVLENQPLSVSEGNQSVSVLENQPLSVSEGDQSVSVLENQPLSVSEGDQSVSVPEYQFMSVSETLDQHTPEAVDQISGSICDSQATLVPGTKEAAAFDSEDANKSTSFSEAVDLSISETVNQSAFLSPDTADQSADLFVTPNQSALVSETLEQSQALSEGTNQSESIYETVDESMSLLETSSQQPTFATEVTESENQSAFVSETLEQSQALSEETNQSESVYETVDESMSLFETSSQKPIFTTEVMESESQSAYVSETTGDQSHPVSEDQSTCGVSETVNQTVCQNQSSKNQSSTRVSETTNESLSLCDKQSTPTSEAPNETTCTPNEIPSLLTLDTTGAPLASRSQNPESRRQRRKMSKRSYRSYMHVQLWGDARRTTPKSLTAAAMKDVELPEHIWWLPNGTFKCVVCEGEGYYLASLRGVKSHCQGGRHKAEAAKAKQKSPEDEPKLKISTTPGRFDPVFRAHSLKVPLGQRGGAGAGAEAGEEVVFTLTNVSQNGRFRFCRWDGPFLNGELRFLQPSSSGEEDAGKHVLEPGQSLHLTMQISPKVETTLGFRVYFRLEDLDRKMYVRHEDYGRTVNKHIHASVVVNCPVRIDVVGASAEAESTG
ncbi:uncharacterized protein LOC143285039 [Babylonia areolata]|uniref:uncharacterized protein LOC143285039 n=1 Tax=Babylonia areolata TaxID=304850 RepID=UPI003FD21790